MAKNKQDAEFGGAGHGQMTPLLKADWHYVAATASDDLRAKDWQLINAQRAVYYAEEQARQVLRFLTAMEDDPSFGYQVNTYRHCLQSATMVMRDGYDEETVVVALLHDIGFVACPTTHGEFAAALLAPYISEANHWMLRHHGAFQNFHCHEYPGLDRDTRERWRGHPHFDWTATFVANYDQNTMDPHYDCAPLSDFEPMVQRIFARTPRDLAGETG